MKIIGLSFGLILAALNISTSLAIADEKCVAVTENEPPVISAKLVDCDPPTAEKCIQFRLARNAKGTELAVTLFSGFEGLSINQNHERFSRRLETANQTFFFSSTVELPEEGRKTEHSARARIILRPGANLYRGEYQGELTFGVRGEEGLEVIKALGQKDPGGDHGGYIGICEAKADDMEHPIRRLLIYDWQLGNNERVGWISYLGEISSGK